MSEFAVIVMLFICIYPNHGLTCVDILQSMLFTIDFTVRCFLVADFHP